MLTILGENASIPHLLPENFPLSKSLGERLRGVSESLHNGRGFAVLRGLDPARYSDRENVALFVGLSGHVGDKRGFKLSKCRKHSSTFSKLFLIQPQITCTTARNQAKIHPGSCLHTYRSQWYEQESPFARVLHTKHVLIRIGFPHGCRWRRQSCSICSEHEQPRWQNPPLELLANLQQDA